VNLDAARERNGNEENSPAFCSLFDMRFNQLSVSRKTPGKGERANTPASGSIHARQQRPEPRNYTKIHEAGAAKFVLLLRVVSCVFVVNSFFIEHE
jgi:hypothetical protein